MGKTATVNDEALNPFPLCGLRGTLDRPDETRLEIGRPDDMPYTYDHPHPAVTADIVLFSLADGAPKVLLIKRKAKPFEGQWALPGGFVEIEENLEAAAARELREETGIEGVKLTQFHTFGAPERDPRERVISVAYWGRLPADAAAPTAGSDAAETRWFNVAALPPLAFDHDEIVRMAQAHLKERE